MKRFLILLAVICLSAACGKDENNGSGNNGGDPDMGGADGSAGDGGANNGGGALTDDRTIPSLSEGERRTVCEELTGNAGGAGTQADCGGGDLRDVPTIGECEVKLEGMQECATLGDLRSCFFDMTTCDKEAVREDCWFLLGDDGGCVAPYLGEPRVPSVILTLPPVPVDCDNPGAIQRIPFSFGSTDVIPLVPGDTVNGLPLEPGLTLDSGSVRLERGRLSVLTEVECASDADCGTGFHCAAGGLPGATRQCTRQTALSLVPGTFQADFEPGVNDEQQQLVGVLIENTSMLDGRLPLATAALFDETGNKDLMSLAERASDPTRVHRDAIQTFLLNLASVADGANTKVTVWWYAGDVPPEARPLINDMDLEDHFTSDLSVGQALIDSMPNPVPKAANLWQAVLSMFRKDFGLEKYQNHEKFLFVFTDGPNEVWDSENTYEGVVAAAQGLGVHIFVVHLDAAVDPTLIRDLPTYYAGGDMCQNDPGCMPAPACSSNNDCQNFEECRPATVYAVNEGDAVSTTPVSYCLPKYNSEGRLGAIDQYADLACRTGGNYMYVANPRQLNQYWGALANSVNGQFSVQGDFSALESANLPGGYYRLGGAFLGLIGSRDLSSELTAPIDATDVESRHILRFGR